MNYSPPEYKKLSERNCLNQIFDDGNRGFLKLDSVIPCPGIFRDKDCIYKILKYLSQSGHIHYKCTVNDSIGYVIFCRHLKCWN